MKRSGIVGAVFAFAAGLAVAGPEIDTSADRVESPLKVSFERIGTLRQRSVAEVGPANWTIDGAPVDRDFVDFDKYRDYLPALGVAKIRILTGWAKSEKVKGRVDVAWLDRIVDWCKAHGIEPILELSYGNPIYEGAGGAGLSDGIPNTPDGLAAWDTWVEFLAGHFKDRVREWAMWNEPDNRLKINTPPMIAAFNVRSAKILRRHMPDCVLHALSLGHNDAKVLEDCVSAMGEDAKLFNTFIYHGYVPNPDFSYAMVEEQKKVIAKYAPAARLRQGENGCGAEWLDKFALSGIPWSEYSQAKWDMRRMLGDLGHDVESGIFCFVDINYKPPTYPQYFSNKKGLLAINAKDDVIRIRRAFYAVQNTVGVFDARVTRVKEPGVSIHDRTVSLYEYRAKGGEPLFVFWDRGPVKYNRKDGSAELDRTAHPGDSFETRPGVLEWSGAPLKDPVWVDLLTGRVYAYPKDLQVEHSCGITLFDVPIYDSPCILTERSALEIVAK